MGLFERFTHKEEIQTLLNEAQHRYDTSLEKLESKKKTTAQRLEKLGEMKIDAWANSMDTFVVTFNNFRNIDMKRKSESHHNVVASDVEPQQMLMNIEKASLTAGEVAKAGFAAVGTGVLVGIASYGGVMMFASASTGTAISALSGAAKTNATLAWFGGGSLKSGGLGIAAGKLVLAGIVVAPILIVGTLIAIAKGKERLAKAKKIHAEALEAAAKFDTMTTGLVGISKMSDNYSSFIKKLERKFEPFIIELKRIKDAYLPADDGKIDFNSLNQVEQKTLHLSWLMAQLYYHVLSTTILTDQGEVSSKASETLTSSIKELKLLGKDTFRMKNEDAPIGNLFWGSAAKKMSIVNFAAMLILTLCGIVALGNSIVLGIACFAGMVIAFPVFIVFRNLPASKLYVWRLIRLTVAVVSVVAVAMYLR